MSNNPEERTTIDGDEDRQKPLFDGSQDMSSGNYYGDMLRPENSDDEDFDKASKSKSDDSEQLKSAEEDADSSGIRSAISNAEKEVARDSGEYDNQIGNGMRNESEGEGIRGRIKRSLSNPRKRKRLLAGGSVAGLVTTISIFGFVALAPLKLIHIVENLQTRFFSASTSATERWSDKLYSKYITQHVLPNVTEGRCKTTRASASCANVDNTQGKLGNLYRAWRDSNLEGKLADKYGMSFERKGNNWTLNMRGETPIILNANFLDGKETIGDVIGGRSEFRSKYKEAFANETKYKRVMYRMKVGKLLERKYGIRRCMVACKYRDQFADWKDDKKLAMKVLLSERVLEPRSEFYNLVFICVLNGNCENWSSVGGDGERRDVLETNLAKRLDAYAEKFGEKEIAKIVGEAEALFTKGYTQYIIDTILTRFLAEEAANQASQVAEKGIPIVGWINFGAKLITQVSGGAEKLLRWRYVMAATSAVGVYMMYRTHADEIKSGNVDGDFVAAFSSQLGDTTKYGQSAENSPIFSELMGGVSGISTSMLESFMPNVYAQTTSDSTTNMRYTCDDKNAPPANSKVCPEERIDNAGFVGILNKIFDTPGLQQLRQAAELWNDTVGKILGIGGKIISFIGDKTGLNSALGAVTSIITEPMQGIIQDIMNKFTNFLFPSPVSDNMSGARTFNMMGMGADIAGNDFSHYGLGGKALTDAEVSEIRSEVESDEQTYFASLPIYKRLFDTTNSRSMVARAAIMMPTSPAAGMYKVSSYILNPFSSIASMFGDLFSSSRASAQTSAADPFGVMQFGIPVNDPVYNIDPELLTEEYCETVNKTWYAEVTVDEKTGIDIHKTVNPCLLQEATIASAGGIFTDSVFSAKDLSENSSAIGNTSAAITDPALCPTTVASIDQTVLVNGVFRVHTCIASSLQAMLDAATADNVSLGHSSSWRSIYTQEQLRIDHGCGGDLIYSTSCIGNPPTAIPGNSMHERGQAIDFAGISQCPSRGSGSICEDPSSASWRWLNTNASKYGFKQLPSEAWHWSITGN